MRTKRAVGESKKSQNRNRKPTEATHYYPVILRVDGEPLGLMLTEHQLKVAAARWAKQPEDRPKHSALKEIRDVLRGRIGL